MVLKKRDKKFSPGQRITFIDLFDTPEWQKIQDNFSHVTGINLRTVDPEGIPITSPSLAHKLCNEIASESWHKNKACGPCAPTFLGGNGVVDKNLVYYCQSGLCNFVAPLRLNDERILGYIILGPVILVARKPKEEYFKIAESLNLNPETFYNAVLEIKIMSYHGMQSVVELCKDIAEFIINLNYKNIVEEKEAVIAFDSPELKRIFEVLLDVALEVSQADIGSVMFVDDKQEHLFIRSSRGLTDDIVKNTRIKIGEGIAGTAAKIGESFLIDQHIVDKRITPHLSRPQIDSSMVMPLRIENRIMGVMNLGALKASGVKFNQDNLNLIDRLINLATIAIK